MVQIVLTDEQSRQLMAAHQRVKLVDSHGQVIGYARPPLFTPEELAEARRRVSSGRRYSVAEKSERIQAIVAELDREESADGV